MFGRKFYHYIEPCPKCGSRRTGRFVAKPMLSAGAYHQNALRNGELIQFQETEPINNLYCADCRYEWAGQVKLKFWKHDRIREEVIIRGTEALYHAVKANRDRIKEQNDDRIFNKNYQDDVYIDDSPNSSVYRKERRYIYLNREAMKHVAERRRDKNDLL